MEKVERSRVNGDTSMRFVLMGDDNCDKLAMGNWSSDFERIEMKQAR